MIEKQAHLICDKCGVGVLASAWGPCCVASLCLMDSFVARRGGMVIPRARDKARTIFLAVRLWNSGLLRNDY